jgi:hypothetical protein
MLHIYSMTSETIVEKRGIIEKYIFLQELHEHFLKGNLNALQVVEHAEKVCDDSEELERFKEVCGLIIEA